MGKPGTSTNARPAFVRVPRSCDSVALLNSQRLNQLHRSAKPLSGGKSVRRKNFKLNNLRAHMP